MLRLMGIVAWGRVGCEEENNKKIETRNPKIEVWIYLFLILIRFSRFDFGSGDYLLEKVNH